MKPLYWTRILAAPEITDGADGKTAIWKEIFELPLDNLNEFTELFSRQAPIRKPTIKKVEEKEKVEAVKLLDNKRSQNVGILAQSLRVDIQEIENAIYNFDTSVVNLESLQQIYEVVSNITYSIHSFNLYYFVPGDISSRTIDFFCFKLWSGQIKIFSIDDNSEIETVFEL